MLLQDQSWGSSESSEEADVIFSLEGEAAGPESLEENSVKYLISESWWKAWKLWSGFGSNSREATCRPGPIDNSDLFSGDQLKPRLQEATDFVLVSEHTWNRLKEWYPKSGPEAQCPVVLEGVQKRPRVMLYPITFTVHCPSGKAAIKTCVCKMATIAELKKKCCEEFEVDQESYDLVDYFQLQEKGILVEDQQSLQDLDLVNNQDLLLKPKGRPIDSRYENEVRTERAASVVVDLVEEEEEAPEESNSMALILQSIQPAQSTELSSHTAFARPKSKYAFNSKKGSSFSIEDTVTMAQDRLPGLVGLSNLGNTCYMNSSLQCLLHTVPLMRCFLSGRYMDDLNRTNPLGQKGELAEAFAVLMGSIWKAGVQHVAPRGFKAKIGRFCRVFSGYGQQDSQELLAFLLDGLHEDMNRVKEKPYIEESKDADKLSDDELASMQWAGHLARNNSPIVDHCLGMYRSTLICPGCNRKSRKFDPVMYLSLPLPESRLRACTVILIHVDGSKPPMKYSVEVPSVGTVRDLLYGLAKVSGIEVAAPSVANSRVASACSALDTLPATVGACLPPQGDGGQPLPQDVMLLAKSSMGWQQHLEVFDDVKTRVSEIVPDERGYDPEYLVCYRYPSPEQGPANQELQQVVIHHRRRKAGSTYSNFICPPTVLLLPPEMINLREEDVTLIKPSSYQSEWLLNPATSGVCPAILRSLDHIRREPSDLDCKATADCIVGEAPDDDAAPSTPQTTLLGGEESCAMPDQVVGVSQIEGDVDASMTCEDGEVQPSDRKEPVAACPTGEIQPFDMWSGKDNAPAPLQFNLRLGLKDKADTSFSSYTEFSDVTSSRRYVVDWENPKLAGPFDVSALEQPPQEHESSVLADKLARAGRQPVSLMACFEAFLQPEQLSEDDSWYCPHCKEHVQADKKLDLWHLPEVLVVHLKRFCQTRSSREKLSTQVDFPLEGLDLSRLLLRPSDGIAPVYDCYAVSNHYGSLGGGHYTAYAKMPDSNKWYNFDDSHVSPVNEDEVSGPAAYVLFYRRRHEILSDPPDQLEQLMLARSQQEAEAERIAAEGPDKQLDQDQGLLDEDDEVLPDLVPDEPLDPLQITGYPLGRGTSSFRRQNSVDEENRSNNGGAMDIGSFRERAFADPAGPASPSRDEDDMEVSSGSFWGRKHRAVAVTKLG